MRKTKGNTHIGTSGWHYKHWKERFYPKETKTIDYFSYYSTFLSTVELNNPFYRLPLPKTFESWRQKSPKEFIFSVKASRVITHLKKLKDCQESLELFLNNVSLLDKKLGIILFQLPPGWKYNQERLINFLKLLPKEFLYTIECRNQTWYNEDLYAVLSENNVAFCIYHLEYHLSPIVTTADFVYVRLHGPETKYAGNYTDKDLTEWAERCKEWNYQGKNFYIYFDNDQNAYAVHNAIKLQEILTKR